MKILSPLIKWSGSKRSQAKKIISFFPDCIETYFEPFLGGGSILGTLSPEKAVCGDICEPLIKLWKLVQSNPKIISQGYKRKWMRLQKGKHLYYYKVRSKFNRTKSPEDFLFLTRTCVNGLIRFNKQGAFNNSFHHSRKGIHPSRLEKITFLWSSIIKKYKFYTKDYFDLTKNATSKDFVYLDPPYFNTRGRYFGKIDFDRFIKYLERLNDRRIKFALSFDGLRGKKSFLVKIPKKLYKRHLLLHSGNASFSKVQNRQIEPVHESLYLNY